MFAMPPVTRALILLNVALYLLERLYPEFMIGLFALWPLGNPMFRPWQLLTYAFLHDPQTFLHIFFNMFALYMFGRTLETYWGGRRFLIYYLVCALAAGITQLAVHDATGRALHGRRLRRRVRRAARLRLVLPQGAPHRDPGPDPAARVAGRDASTRSLS